MWISNSHRPDPETPLEKAMAALDHVLCQGKALYAGISSYDPEQTRRGRPILDSFTFCDIM
jgi:L-glyceraldehyde 3-phosphate reductase